MDGRTNGLMAEWMVIFIFLFAGAYGKGGPGGPWTPQSTFLPRPLGAFFVNSVGSFWEEEELGREN